MVYTYIHTYKMVNYSAIKKNEILPLAATWMGLEKMMFREKYKYSMTSLIYGI